MRIDKKESHKFIMADVWGSSVRLSFNKKYAHHDSPPGIQGGTFEVLLSKQEITRLIATLKAQRARKDVQ